MTDLNSCYSNNCSDTKTILDDIKILQDEEQAALDSLKNDNGSGYNISEQQMKGFIGDINKLTEDRINLYTALSQKNVSDAVTSIDTIDVLDNTADGLSKESTTLSKESTTLSGADNTENNLNNQKDKLNKNLKKIEINSYYSKTYDSQRILLKSVFIYLAIILVLLYLGKFFPVIPTVVINLLIAIIIIVAVFNTVRKLYDMGKRTPNNFDEIDWWWSPDMIFKSGLPANKKDQYGATSLQDLYKRDCKGENCCDTGTQFDPSTGKCKVTTTTSKDGFQNAFPLKSCGRRVPTGSNSTFTGYNQLEIKI